MRTTKQEPTKPGRNHRWLLRRTFLLLPRADQRKWRSMVVLQMSTAFLDLAGVMLFGMVGVLAAASVQGTPPPAAMQSALNVLGLGDWPPDSAALTLATLAAGLLICKSLVTLAILRVVTRFLARCSSETSARLATQFFSLPLVRIQRFSSQRSSFSLSHGVNAAVIDVLNNSMILRVETMLLAVLAAALLMVDPWTTLAVMAYFAFAGLLLTKGLSSWSRRTGLVTAETDVAAISAVQDGIATYREVTVAGHRDYYLAKFNELRWRGTQATADQRFITQIPRYAMEAAMVLGAALLTGFLAATQSAESAVGSLALFLTAATRVMPALLRLNGARLALHNVGARAEYAFELDDFMAAHVDMPHQAIALDVGSPNTTAPLAPMTLEVSELCVAYPEGSKPALDHVTLSVPAGARLAIVGPSGSGKTTLVDSILGVVKPNHGSVLLAGLPPAEAIRSYPGGIGYVPQNVALVSGTIRDNVALGLRPDQIDDDRVWEALRRARLASFLVESRDGLDTAVGEHGARLSGGQRQRLGIARALFTRPRLLVLDEATSALDAQTENLITGTLDELAAEVTTVTIAHRLATIRQADVVVYLGDGRVIAKGTFEEVRSTVPQFDHQAELLGL